MRRWNIGLMGAGNIAGAMAATIKRMKGVTLYGIASRTEEKAAAFAKQYGVKKAYGSYEAMVGDDKVDLVYIATPHSEHYDNAMLCIRHKKPVLCEKAFTANAGQAREVLQYAEKEKVFVTEAIWTRYMPMVDMIRDVINGGLIGRPMLLYANFGHSLEHIQRMYDPALAGGSLLDLGVYPISFAFLFFGTNIAKVSSFCTYTETGVDRQETITIQYTDGKVANLMASQCCISDKRGVIQGSEGFMVVENINNYESFTVYDKDGKKILCRKAPKQISGYEYEVMACMQALRKGELECPQMPHAETIRVMEFMDSLREEWGIVYPFEKETV